MQTSSPGFSVPYPLAMVVCDAVWTDPTSGKKTILGTFSSIFASAFPALHPVLTVFLAFTDCAGKVPLRLCLATADEDEAPIGDFTSEVDVKDRRAVVEVIFPLVELVFPKPGEYSLQAYAGGEFLIERRVLVINPQEPTNG